MGYGRGKEGVEGVVEREERRGGGGLWRGKREEEGGWRKYIFRACIQVQTYFYIPSVNISHGGSVR